MSKPSLYRQILRDKFDDLPPQVQALHACTKPCTWGGEAEVIRGKGLIAALVCRMFGFPKSHNDIPVRVSFDLIDEVEFWCRDFDGQRFKSEQWLGVGRNQGLLVERFGPFRVAMKVPVSDGRLQLVPISWTFWGMPLPKVLLPSDQSFEFEEDGRFCFSVEVAVPIAGLIVAYRGWLEPAKLA